MKLSKWRRDSGFCVYIGPSVPRVITTGKVYRGNKSEALYEAADVIDAFPLVEKLIVTDRELPEARLKVKQKGNYLHTYFSELQEILLQKNQKEVKP